MFIVTGYRSLSSLCFLFVNQLFFFSEGEDTLKVIFIFLFFFCTFLSSLFFFCFCVFFFLSSCCLSFFSILLFFFFSFSQTHAGNTALHSLVCLFFFSWGKECFKKKRTPVFVVSLSVLLHFMFICHFFIFTVFAISVIIISCLQVRSFFFSLGQTQTHTHTHKRSSAYASYVLFFSPLYCFFFFLIH